MIKSKYYVIGGYTPSDVTKYAILGLIHGLFLNKRVAKMIERWFNKYLNEKPKTTLLIHFKYKNPGRTNIVKLIASIFLGDSELVYRKDVEELKRRILGSTRGN